MASPPITHYEARAGPNHFADMRTSGAGVAASLEVGAPLSLGGGLSLEPQAQVIFQKIDLDDSGDGAAEVSFSDVESLTCRIGLRLVHNSSRPGTNGLRPIRAPPSPRRKATCPTARTPRAPGASLVQA